MHALGELHAAGHLTFDALDERICAALAAETEEELAVLLSDLPDTTTDSWSPFGGEAEAATGTRPEQKTETKTAPTAAPTAAPRAARPDVRRLGQSAAAVLATLGVALVTVAAAMLAGARKVAAWSWALLCEVGAWLVNALAAMRRRREPAPPAQDLVAVPQPQAPMQWEPIKVYAVRVPMDPEPVASELPAPTVRELPTAERPALMPGRTEPERELAAESAEDNTAPAEDEAARGTGGPLRPLLDRVTQRAHGRRSGIFPRQRESHEAAERTSRPS